MPKKKTKKVAEEVTTTEEVSGNEVASFDLIAEAIPGEVTEGEFDNLPNGWDTPLETNDLDLPDLPDSYSTVQEVEVFDETEEVTTEEVSEEIPSGFAQDDEVDPFAETSETDPLDNFELNPDAFEEGDDLTVKDLDEADQEKIPVTEDLKGNPYFEGMEEGEMPKLLKQLGDDASNKLRAMQKANLEFREAKGVLMSEMQKCGVNQYRLDSGFTVELTKTFNVKIKKERDEEDESE